MPFIKSATSILESGGNVIASDLTVDGTTVTVDETNNRLGVNTNTPQGTIGVDGDLYLQPTAISTSHIVGTGSIDMRADANIKIGTETADSVKIGRTNTTAAKVHISSGTESDLVVSNSMVGIGTDSPTQALELDGNIQLSPSAISTAHIFTTGSLDLRASANIKIGTDGADSVKIGRVNTGAVKCHIRSGGANDLVVSNSMVGIGTDSPDHTLSVAGDIDISGGLSFDGGTAVDAIDTDISSVAGTDTTLASAKAIKSYVDTVAGGSTDLTSDVTGTLPVPNGGTGAASLTDGGVLLGSGTGAVTATAVLTNGQILIGDGSGDPTVATLTAGTGVDVTNGAGSITIAADVSDFLSNGSDNRIVTATGTDAMNAEAGLTFDGNTLTITDAVSDTNAGTFTALAVDFDKTGASESSNTMIGVDVDMDNTTAIAGTNSMTGIKVTPTCTHPSGSGTVNVKGLEVVATGSTSPETSTVRALDLIATGGDYNQGIYLKVADGGPDLKMVSSADVGDYATIAVSANGATTFATNDDDGTNADLSFSVDGSFDVTATSASFSSTVTVGGLTIGSAAISETELEILDGATATTTEINLLDGDTSVGGSITIADADGFIVNDGGTTKLVPASDLKTYAGGGGSAADDSNLVFHMQVFA